MNRKREMESFSTFGGTRASSAARLSQTRLDLKPECDMNMISLMHNGKEYTSIPRRVPIPTIPSSHFHPHIYLQMESVEPAQSLKSANSHYNPPEPTSVSDMGKGHEQEEAVAKDLEEATVPNGNVITSISTPV